jgi:hypothetical protein
MTKTKAKREPTYFVDCVLPPTDVTADGFLAKHHTQHMQKALDQMNIQLHHVISDITGVTGLAITMRFSVVSAIQRN